MLINIVTPCSRPENLLSIAESINIPRDNYRWIVVFDSTEIPKVQLPDNAEYYIHKNEKSVVGHSQRNFANLLIDEGYVLMLDDDTVMHPEFWQEVKDYNHDIISWKQANKDGSHRLNAGMFTVNNIDSGSFMVKREVIGNLQWQIDAYDSDGRFAEEVNKKTNSKVSIDKYISYYNYLR
jgi:hypothetical protein